MASTSSGQFVFTYSFWIDVSHLIFFRSCSLTFLGWLTTPLFYSHFLSFSLQMFSVVLTILSMIAISKAEELGVFFQIEEKSLLLSEDAIWNGEVNSLLSCSHMCARQALCKSAGYITEGGTCSLHRETKKMYPDRFLQRQGSFYVEKVCHLSCACTRTA